MVVVVLKGSRFAHWLFRAYGRQSTAHEQMCVMGTIEVPDGCPDAVVVNVGPALEWVGKSQFIVDSSRTEEDQLSQLNRIIRQLVDRAGADARSREPSRGHRRKNACRRSQRCRRATDSE